MKFNRQSHFDVVGSSEKVPDENTTVNFEYITSKIESLLVIHIIKKFITFKNRNEDCLLN
jgi:hypothetical protein